MEKYFCRLNLVEKDIRYKISLWKEDDSKIRYDGFAPRGDEILLCVKQIQRSPYQLQL